MITEKQVKKFKSLGQQLAKLIREIKNTDPETEYYVCPGTLNLMSGPAHEGSAGTPCPERVVAMVHIPTLDGGDW